jgi:hypothetical protein
MSGTRQRGISYGTTVKLNVVSDPVCGGSNNFGTGATLYGGIRGIEIEFKDDQVFYDPTVGTLYGGVYKYVQTVAAADRTTAPARGLIAFWYNDDNFVVTADATDGNQCGVFLNAITSGDWGWIQVGGDASVLFSEAITKATPAVKDVVVCDSGLDTADVESDSTSYTNLIYKRILGIAKEVPVAGAISVVELLDRFSQPYK